MNHKAFKIAILFYMAVLLMASYREEIRPSFLDFPYLVSHRLLNFFGIRPGVPVVTGKDVIRHFSENECFTIVAYSTEKRKSLLYQTSPECQKPSTRWRENRLDSTLYMMLKKVSVDSKGASGLRPGSRGYLFAQAMGDHFCHRDGQWRRVVFNVKSQIRVLQTLELLRLDETILDWNCKQGEPESP